MSNGKKLRYQILKYLLEREHAGEALLAEAAEIATDLDITEQHIIDQIDILESKGAVIANRTFNSVAPMLTGEGKALLEDIEESLDTQSITDSLEEIEDLRPEEYAKPPREEFEWDVFISHATEDKEEFVDDLATRLSNKGIRVWYDEFTLEVGDSIRESIEKGIRNSRFGIVVLSPAFYKKNWTQKELSALIERDAIHQKVILPIWLNVNYETVKQKSPFLSNKKAVRAEEGLEKVVTKLMRVIG